MILKELIVPIITNAWAFASVKNSSPLSTIFIKKVVFCLTYRPSASKIDTIKRGNARYEKTSFYFYQKNSRQVP